MSAWHVLFGLCVVFCGIAAVTSIVGGPDSVCAVAFGAGCLCGIASLAVR